MTDLLPWPPSEVSTSLVLAVKKNDRWAIWSVADSMANLLFRPGVFDYQGEASAWMKAIPEQQEHEGRNNVLLCEGKRPEGLAPGDGGLLVLDYDQKAYYSCQTLESDTVFNLASWGNRTRQATSALRAWVRPLIENGYLPVAHWEDGTETPVPDKIPANLLWVPKYLERALRRSRGMSDAGPDFPDSIELPLEVPGWSFCSWVRGQTSSPLVETFQTVEQAYGLSDWEKQHWHRWAVENNQPSLAATAKASLLDERWADPEASVPKRRL